MAQKFNVIHIFAYGETQIIGDDFNFKTATTGLTKVQAVIDNIKSTKPTDKPTGDFHAINIFNNDRYSYLGQERAATFILNFSELDAVKLQALADELGALIPPAPVVNGTPN